MTPTYQRRLASFLAAGISVPIKSGYVVYRGRPIGFISDGFRPTGHIDGPFFWGIRGEPQPDDHPGWRGFSELLDAADWICALVLPRLRPSGLQLGQICPASTHECLREDLRPTTDMARGVSRHRFFELMIGGGRNAARTYLDETRVSAAERRELASLWGWLDSKLRYLLRAELPTLEGAATTPRDELTLYPELWLDCAPAAWPYRMRGRIDLLALQPGRALVCDYKDYFSHQVPLEQDLQLLAYALGVLALAPQLETITLARINTARYWVDTLELDRDALTLLSAALHEVTEDIWSRRDQYVLGAHCQSCPAARVCPTRAKVLSGIEHQELEPYRGGSLESADAVRRFLLAAPALEVLLEAGWDAAKCYVLEHGPIEDPASGKRWGPREQSRDRIVDARACLSRVAELSSPAVAMAAVSTSKSAITTALKQVGIAWREQKALLEELRGAGAIETRSEHRWEWR